MQYKMYIALSALIIVVSGCKPITAPNTEVIPTNTPAIQPTTEELTEETDPIVETNSVGSYEVYTPQAYAAANQKRVLFFHATWCPTCKAANEDITENLDQIPEGVVVLKTDYDTEDALKDKYKITYQHTFVQVDEVGNEVTKWSGGGIEELQTNIL